MQKSRHGRILPVSDLITRRHNALFGQVAGLSDFTPAHQALRCEINLSQTRSSGFGIGPAIPFLPSLSPSFPLSSPPLPLEVGPLNPARGSGGALYKLPQWGLGQSPSRQTIWCISGPKEAALVATVLWIFVGINLIFWWLLSFWYLAPI